MTTTAPPTSQAPGAGRSTTDIEPLRVLLVEDDERDVLRKRMLLGRPETAIHLIVAASMAEALPLIGGVDCVLLDLDLPDDRGLPALRRVLSTPRAPAVCVLTGWHDDHLGRAALAEGAQDYLVKGQADGVLLARSLRYAVERRRADDNARRLQEVELRQAESGRLERGLLPQPLATSDAIEVCSRYRSGRDRGVLGGDFLDVVQTRPDRIDLLIGDVCGHGVEEAALGVALRVAWRALVLAGVPEPTVLPAVEQVLISERRAAEIFATIGTVRLDLTAHTATLRLAGHPPPLLLRPGAPARPLTSPGGRLLGVVPKLAPAATASLPGEDWSLLLFTDGLIEGHGGQAGERLGVEGLCALLDSPAAADVDRRSLPDWLISQAEDRNGGPLTDDVAVLLVGRRPTAQ
ncbi:PP2C family protein-serine/threonine phosphatase [Pilimelia columellifera]|uniref:SpoIIE family protein phosphatase n=1 Tax=Pilimelia columellifera subsp. columellifera TaxID=706583 RepID=A0ABP6AMZ8_9ACTN